MLFLQYGCCSIAVLACEGRTSRHLQEVSGRVPSWVRGRDVVPDCTLTIVPPWADAIAEPKWQTIAKTWSRAHQGLHEPSPRVLAAWRDLYALGKSVERNKLLFQDIDGGGKAFFALLPGDALKTPEDHVKWIIHIIRTLAVYWHVLYGGTPLHAAGVSRHGYGYLFLGPSGAGKSTVAGLSEYAQGAVIHDDRLLVGRLGEDYLLLRDDCHIAPVLRAVFLLRKGDTNRLTALGSQAIYAHLAKSILDYMVMDGRDLLAPWTQQAFRNAAAIARSVPGYELSFRKSPDFWRVIDAELGS